MCVAVPSVLGVGKLCGSVHSVTACSFMGLSVADCSSKALICVGECLAATWCVAVFVAW